MLCIAFLSTEMIEKESGFSMMFILGSQWTQMVQVNIFYLRQNVKIRPKIAAHTIYDIAFLYFTLFWKISPRKGGLLIFRNNISPYSNDILFIIDHLTAKEFWNKKNIQRSLISNVE